MSDIPQDVLSKWEMESKEAGYILSHTLPCTDKMRIAYSRFLTLIFLIRKKDSLIEEALTYKNRPTEVEGLLSEALKLTEELK